MLNHAKIQYYQKWKKLAFPSNADSGVINNKDRIMSILSTIITSTENFNRCIENDQYLSLILNEKLADIFRGQMLATDMVFYGDVSGGAGAGETREEALASQSMKVYHDASGEQVDLASESLAGQSILGRVLTGRAATVKQSLHFADQLANPITVVNSISTD